MVGWQYSECHVQCLSKSTPRSRGHQCVNPVSFGKNDSQLHLLWYTSPVSDADALNLVCRQFQHLKGANGGFSGLNDWVKTREYSGLLKTSESENWRRAKTARRMFEDVSGESRRSRITLLQINGMSWSKILAQGESEIWCEEMTRCERRGENAKTVYVREDVENNRDDRKLVLLALISYYEQ